MKLIFCFPKILRNSHRVIFELDLLVDRGFEVILLDLTAIHGGKSTCEDPVMLEMIHTCKSIEEVNLFVEDLDDSPVIYLSNDGYLTKAYNSLVKLRRKQDRLLAINTKTIPSQREDLGVFKSYLKKTLIKSDTSFHFFGKLYTLNHRYVIPDYFLCSTLHVLPLKTLLTVRKKNIIIAHSDDVNAIIRDKTKPEKDNNTGVFLDQVIPISLQHQLPDDYFEKYYSNLTRTLKVLKKELGLDEIIIAEHPESGRFGDRLTEQFHGFKRIRNHTQQLIKDSTYVFAHFSTSIGFAVYYQKPLIILTDSVLNSNKHAYHAMQSFIKILNCPTMSMEGEVEIVKEDTKVNLEAYREYIKKFMEETPTSQSSYVSAIELILRDIKNLERSYE